MNKISGWKIISIIAIVLILIVLVFLGTKFFIESKGISKENNKENSEEIIDTETNEEENIDDEVNNDESDINIEED